MNKDERLEIFTALAMHGLLGSVNFEKLSVEQVPMVAEGVSKTALEVAKATIARIDEEHEAAT